MDKRVRQDLILKLIKTNEITTQEEMLEVLSREGLTVTQATVSRDIKELGLVKTGGNVKKYMYSNMTKAEDSVKRLLMLKTAVESVEMAQNIIVVKTLPGNGGAIAALLDQNEFENILGSIAGDDTIFIVARDNESCELAAQKIREMLI